MRAIIREADRLVNLFDIETIIPHLSPRKTQFGLEMRDARAVPT